MQWTTPTADTDGVVHFLLKMNVPALRCADPRGFNTARNGP
jgi:hypothetical protein